MGVSFREDCAALYSDGPRRREMLFDTVQVTEELKIMGNRIDNGRLKYLNGSKIIKGSINLAFSDFVVRRRVKER